MAAFGVDDLDQASQATDGRGGPRPAAGVASAGSGMWTPGSRPVSRS
ncbi:hypothetical protein H4W33_008185 [Kibdelosporangium phytohabitans]|nr:hypothetical protein [Kibdelosporangium phytohabitans]MBE1469111.1 hypothetical protein [Kibdelosporangium phytohabitans]